MAIDQIVAEELTRLITAKADLKTSIEAKGVTVPSSAKLDDYHDYVDAISVGATLQAKSNITPTESSQTITADNGYDGLSSVQINAISSSYVGSGIPRRTNADLYVLGASVTVPQGFYESATSKKVSMMSLPTTTVNSTSYTSMRANFPPSETTRYLEIPTGYHEEEQYYKIDGVSSTYVGSGITQRTSSDLTASGATVTAPAGYYSSDATKTIPNAVLDSPTWSTSKDSTYYKTSYSAPISTAGYLNHGLSGTYSILLEDKSVTPSEIQQVVTPTNNSYYLNNVTVNAIPSSYVGSGVTRRSSSDLTISGGISDVIVTAPSGYYSSNANYSIPYSDVGVPTNERTKENGTFVYTRSFPQFTPGYQASASPVVLELILEDKTVTPSTSQQVITPTATNYYLNSVTVDAMPSGSATPAASISGSSATVTAGTNTLTFTKTISNTPQVSAGYISSGTAGNTNVSLTASINTRSSSDLTSSNLTVTAPSGYYASNATKTLTDANLLATNIKKDVSIFGVTGTYEGSGGGSSSDGVYVDDSYNDEMNTASSSIEFNGLLGAPTSFIIRSITPNMATPSGTPYKVVAVVYDGTSYHGQTLTNTNNAQVSYDGSSFSHTYSNGILTVTSTGPYFQPNDYMLEYSYGGTAANVHTANVQVGSGATSITFTGLEDEPLYWSCIFKSNFSTSNGYQRVIWVENTSNTIVGMAMDSSGHYSGSLWTASYNNGSLTISSQGTNSGGYFHQPGYYQLTYVTASSGGGEGGGETINNQDKTVTPSETQQTITADSGYTGLGTVTVGAIDSYYVGSNVTRKAAATITPGTTNQTIATGTYLTGTQTISGDSDLIASNIKSGVSIFNVTGTYTGDVVTGTLNVASNVNSSTSTQITTTTAIGYTPTKFLFYKTERTATSNHVHQATFTTIGSYYIRTMTRYSSNALSTSGNTNNWTTQTAGYLYFNNNTIYFRSSSSYILSAGTWNWVAIR